MHKKGLIWPILLLYPHSISQYPAASPGISRYLGYLPVSPGISRYLGYLTVSRRSISPRIPVSPCIPLYPPAEQGRTLRAACAHWLSTLFRAAPYTIHAACDGAILGSVHSPLMLASLALPIALCAVQDVGTILINLGATGAAKRDVVLFTTVCFGAGFPIGAGVASAGASLPMLPAFAGGLFVYMALFELAPPHAHGRAQSARQLLYFSTGLAAAYVTEEAEKWAAGVAQGDDRTLAACALGVLATALVVPLCCSHRPRAIVAPMSSAKAISIKAMIAASRRMNPLHLHRSKQVKTRAKYARAVNADAQGPS